MRSLLYAIAAAAAVLSFSLPGAAQGLPFHWNNVRSSWESLLEAGDGQKVRQEAEALLKRPDIQASQSNYNDQHAKVAILSIAARGAVLDGDWAAAVSLLSQAASAAQANLATTHEALDGLRKQHDAKIGEWKDLIRPQEEQLHWLHGLPILSSEQNQQVIHLESFLSEHNRAIANSQQSIEDIDGILSTLKAEDETCAKSLNDWNGFLMKERLDIQELGSQQRYVAEKIAQISGDDSRSRFELISYIRRLLRLDPENEDCQKFLASLTGTRPPAETAEKKDDGAPAVMPTRRKG